MKIGQEIRVGLSERLATRLIAGKHGYVVNKFTAWVRMYQVRVDGESYWLFENEIVMSKSNKDGG